MRLSEVMPHRSPRPARTVVAALLALATSVAATATNNITVTLPSGVGFAIGVTSPITGSPDPTTISFSSAQISGTQHVRISVTADTTSFTQGAGPASSVTWTTANAVNGTGSSGTLSNGAYTVVYSGTAGKTSGSLDIHWSFVRPSPPPAYTHSAALTLRWRLDFF